VLEPVSFIPAPANFRLAGQLREASEWLVFALAGAYLWVVFDLLDRLRQQVGERICAELPEEASVSVSIGVTELAAAQDQPERLMSRADLALYMAKAAGRDRCEAMTAEGVVPPRAAAPTW